MYKSNKFCDILGIEKGLTALIGSGGKTSLMMRLAEELCEQDRTIICTTTHIMRPEGILTAETVEELEEIFGQQDGTGKDADDLICGRKRPHSPVCIGSPAKESGKLSAPSVSFSELKGMAGFVIAEADGSRRLPVKCHAPHEPVIPEETDKVIWIVGLSGIWKKAAEAVHRPELFKKITGLGPEDTVTPRSVAEIIRAEAPLIMGSLTGKSVSGSAAAGKQRSVPVYIFINQADTAGDLETARELAAELSGMVCFAGSVKNGTIERI